MSAEYDRTTCPYCMAPLDSLPKAKARCPACRRPIWVRRAPDGLRHLLRREDLDAFEDLWLAEMDRRADEEALRINVQAHGLAVRSLASLAAAGVRHVETLVSADACSACAAWAGRIVSIGAAPEIPVIGCTSEICRCDYRPVFD